MNDQIVFSFLKQASFENNNTLRSNYETIKRSLVKTGQETDEHRKLALFLAAKKTLKQAMFTGTETADRLNTPGTPGATMPLHSTPVAPGGMSAPPSNAIAPTPSIVPAPNPMKPKTIAKSDISKTTGSQARSVSPTMGGKVVTSNWTRW